MEREYMIGRAVMPGMRAPFPIGVEIELTETRLSFSAWWAQSRNSGGAYQGGQMQDTLRELVTAGAIRYAAGWDRPRMVRLLDAWDRWHLSDMRAGCEHQRAAGWDTRPIDPDKPLDTYGLHFPGQRHATWNMLTWIRPDEHPEGLLTAECPECGYRYGTAWLTEELPADVREAAARAFA